MQRRHGVAEAASTQVCVQRLIQQPNERFTTFRYRSVSLSAMLHWIRLQESLNMKLLSTQSA